MLLVGILAVWANPNNWIVAQGTTTIVDSHANVAAGRLVRVLARIAYACLGPFACASACRAVDGAGTVAGDRIRILAIAALPFSLCIALAYILVDSVYALTVAGAILYCWNLALVNGGGGGGGSGGGRCGGGRGCGGGGGGGGGGGSRGGGSRGGGSARGWARTIPRLAIGTARALFPVLVFGRGHLVVPCVGSFAGNRALVLHFDAIDVSKIVNGGD